MRAVSRRSRKAPSVTRRYYDTNRGASSLFLLIGLTISVGCSDSLNSGVILLEQLIPGSSAVTPIAGALIATVSSA